MVMFPPALISDAVISSSLMEARVVLVTALAARVTCTAAPPDAAMPPAKLNIVDFVSAPMSRVVPASTVEPAISAVTLLVMTFAPMMAETAAEPEAATLSPKAVIWDWSIASRSTRPPDPTVEPPVMEASTALVITLPKAVA